MTAYPSFGGGVGRGGSGRVEFAVVGRSSGVRSGGVSVDEVELEDAACVGARSGSALAATVGLAGLGTSGGFD